jgi:methylthioribose-1-phosphate isomerase
MVSKLMTAADRVTLSGHVINKVGTHQLAIAAQNFGLPYFAMVQAPDKKAQTPDDVPMEERDGNETLQCLGMATASPLARGWYPAFDVTPPHLVSAVATSVGVFPAALLRNRFG